MALILEQQCDTRLPIVAESLTPNRLRGIDNCDILDLNVWHGNRKLAVGELFRVSGDLQVSSAPKPDLRIIFRGHTQPIQNLGRHMSDGTIVVEGDVGDGCGRQMSGGNLIVMGDARDEAGSEMTGGVLTIRGNAGRKVGGGYPGHSVGMNGGVIVVAGSVGDGAGASMRRGTLVIGGNAGRLAGWNMLAGTIVIAGDCGANCGANMKRGTIVYGQRMASSPVIVFAEGSTRPLPVLTMLGRWLDESADLSLGEMLKGSLVQFHGDLTMGGRGELFLQNHG